MIAEQAVWPRRGRRRARRAEVGVGRADYSSAIHAAPRAARQRPFVREAPWYRLEANEATRAGCGGSGGVLRGATSSSPQPVRRSRQIGESRLARKNRWAARSPRGSSTARCGVSIGITSRLASRALSRPHRLARVGDPRRLVVSEHAVVALIGTHGPPRPSSGVSSSLSTPLPNRSGSSRVSLTLIRSTI
jgi:hypothetical protein